MGYGLDDRGLESRMGLEIYLLTTAPKLVLGAHPGSYMMGNRDSFPGAKKPGT